MFHASPNLFTQAAVVSDPVNLYGRPVSLLEPTRSEHTLAGNSFSSARRYGSRFASVKALTEGWDGPGSVPIAERAIVMANQAFEYAQAISPTKLDLAVVPCADGGLQLELHSHAHRFEICFDVDGSTRAWWHDRVAATEVEAEGKEALRLLAQWAVRNEAWPVLSVAA